MNVLFLADELPGSSDAFADDVQTATRAGHRVALAACRRGEPQLCAARSDVPAARILASDESRGIRPLLGRTFDETADARVRGGIGPSERDRGRGGVGQ